MERMYACQYDGMVHSVVYPVSEPVAGRAFAIAAVEAAIGELQIVVVARARLVAPPLRGDAPRAGDGDHASAETRAAHEAGSPALREHLERPGRAERAHDEAAGQVGRGGVGEDGWRRHDR